MPSSNNTTRARRWLKWLLAAAILVVILYCGGWYYLTAQVRSRIDGALANLNRNGVIAQCNGLQISGFPFGINISCDNLNYEDSAKRTYGSTGAIRAYDHIYDPLLATTEIDGPMRLEAPSIIPLWIDWEELRGGVRYGSPLPKRAFISASGIMGQTDPDGETNPEELFRIASLSGRVTPLDGNVVARGEFVGLDLLPIAVNGSDLPLLNGEGEAVLVDGINAIASRTNSFRGQKVELSTLSLTDGQASVSMTGPISVGADGLIDAGLEISVTDVQALSSVLQRALPAHAREIGMGLSVAAMGGKDIKIKLNIVQGKAKLGPIPLGDIPPLE